MASYPKTGQVVAKYTGERPCTRDPYKKARVTTAEARQTYPVTP